MAAAANLLVIPGRLYCPEVLTLAAGGTSPLSRTYPVTVWCSYPEQWALYRPSRPVALYSLVAVNFPVFPAAPPPASEPRASPMSAAPPKLSTHLQWFSCVCLSFLFGGS